jgi:SnoaL-like polyketide cyclase
VAHAAPLTGTGPDQIRGREGLNGWISGIHAILPDLALVIEVGPITDEEHMAVRWKARGTYRGGFPGSAPEAVGREVIFTGTDTLRIAGGQFAEYWANADSLLVMISAKCSGCGGSGITWRCGRWPQSAARVRPWCRP